MIKNRKYKNLMRYSFFAVGLLLMLTACNNTKDDIDFNTYNIQGETPITKEISIDLDEQIVLDAKLSDILVVVAVEERTEIYLEPDSESELIQTIDLGDSFEVKDEYKEDNELVYYEIILTEELNGFVSVENVTESKVEQVEIKQYKIFDVIGTYWYNSGLIIVYSSEEKQQYDLVYYNPMSNEAMTLYTGDRAVKTLLDVVETDLGLGFCFNGEVLYLDPYSLNNIGRIFLEPVLTTYDRDNNSGEEVVGDAVEYIIAKDNTIYYGDGSQIKRRFANGEEELFYSFVGNEVNPIIKKIDLSEDESRLIFAIENEGVNTSWVELIIESKEVVVQGIYESDLYFVYDQTAVGYDYRKNTGIFTVDFNDGDRVDYVSKNFTTESFLDKVYGSNLLLIKDAQEITVFDPEFNKVVNRFKLYDEVKGYLNTAFVDSTIKVIDSDGDLIHIYSFDTGYRYVENVMMDVTPQNAKGYIIEDTFVTTNFSASNPYSITGGEGLTLYDSKLLELDRKVMLPQGSFYLDKWNHMSSISDYKAIEKNLDGFLSFEFSDTRIAYLNLKRELIVTDRLYTLIAKMDGPVINYRVFGENILYSIAGEGVFLWEQEGEDLLLTKDLPEDYGFKEGIFYYVDEKQQLVAIKSDGSFDENVLKSQVATAVYGEEIVFTTIENSYSGLYYIENSEAIFVRVLPILNENELDYGFLFKGDYYFGESYENGTIVLQSTVLGNQLLNDKAIYTDEDIILFAYEEQTGLGNLEVLAIYEIKEDTFRILTTGEEVVSYQEVEGMLFLFCESDTLGSLYSLNLETLMYTNMYNVEGEIVKVSEDGSKVATMSYNVGWNFQIIDTATGDVLYEKKYADLITSSVYGIFITVGQQIIHVNINTMATKVLVYDCKDGYNARTYIHYNRTRNILYYHSINNVLYALDMKTLKATYVFSECVQIFRFISDDSGFNNLYLLGGNGLLYNYNGTSILPLDLKEIVSFNQYSKDTDFKDLVTRYGNYVIYTNTVNGTIHAYNELEGYTKDLLRISNENVVFEKVTIARSDGVQKLLVVYNSPTLGDVELYLDLDSLQ